VILEAHNGQVALDVIGDESPDIVLLDIEMPGRNGLDVVAALPAGAAPHVVFVTAYDAYAVRAFELAAVDYLLKPFDEVRLVTAMSRAKRALSSERRQEDLAELVAILRREPTDVRVIPDRLPIEDGGRRVLVRFADITRVEADGEYVRIHVGSQMRTMRSTLSGLERRLDPLRFARVGRGAIVNIAHVHAWESVGHGDFVLTLRDGNRVRLSRRYVDGVAARLGIKEVKE
jgi:two-component system LytT family response regulator